MKLQILLVWCFVWSCFGLFAQKKQLQHEDIATWNNITDTKVSNNGSWVTYQLQPGEGDSKLMVFNTKSGKEQTFERSETAQISADNKYVIFTIKPPMDTVKAMKRRKVDKAKLPKDTLAVLDLASGELNKLANVKGFKLPEQWSDWLFFQLDPVKMPKDTTEQKKRKKSKKPSKKSGYPLVIHQFSTGRSDTIPFVKTYTLAEEQAQLILHSSGEKGKMMPGVYAYDFNETDLIPLHRSKGNYKQLNWDKAGQQAAFLVDTDTTEVQIRQFELHHWKIGQDSAKLIADSATDFLPDNWLLSQYAKPTFSADGSKLYFGIAPPPIVKDTSLLEEEIVNVEVWHYQDPYLYTREEVRLKQTKERNYRTVLDINNRKFIQLASEEIPASQLGNEGDADYVLGYHEESYAQTLSWEGYALRDYYLISTTNGEKTKIATGLNGYAQLSPEAEYAFWYNRSDTAWFSYSIATDKTTKLTENEDVVFFDELNDRPMLPSPYGFAGWTNDDQHFLVYDRYDIWKVDPTGKNKVEKLTDGRSQQLQYRYVKLNREERSIDPNKPLLLYVFDEKSKGSGYASLDLKTGKLTSLFNTADYLLDRNPVKAKEADVLVTTKENFNTFPDLYLTTGSFKNQKRISKANPQQADYSWGTNELYEWTSLDGQKLQGMLMKPEGFDPNKKYPMMVYFYERSSNRLNRYNRPSAGRSSINYSFYVSRGYVVFNPDIPYEVGYPGESAYNSVVSGVTALIDEGFVDKERIGIQGHSWGGYQIAYILTKTDLFKCAESGAPVVNMTSAYGGIRWGSGRSRMFQYERTQSRIGGTLWEKPIRYIENSPLFFTDKIKTPVLILHNDEDTAVPWYQGIEFFVALRRLGKPAWLLNYNGEPHGITKLQNRKDFQRRMQQFFDHYLMDAPLPKWMASGVPPIEKGINQGFEPSETDEK